MKFLPVPFFTTIVVLARVLEGNADCCVQDLIAGGGSTNSATTVGEVQVCYDEGFEVTYIVDEAGWCLFETHLAVEANEVDIPQTNKGNPIPGQFENSNEHDCVSEYTYPIGDCAEMIAAHAVVGSIWGADLDPAYLPDTVSISLNGAPGPGSSSYWFITITNGGVLNGQYNGWCIDVDTFIDANSLFNNVAVYSSYEDLPGGLVEFPENLDLVNWIVNQDYVGEPSPDCTGDYTYGDVQRAIWELIDDYPFSISALGTWSECRVDEIINAAADNDGFVPDCGQDVAVILVPYLNANQDEWRQITFVPVPAPCPDETAWADGIEFVGDRGWATYFMCEEVCP